MILISLDCLVWIGWFVVWGCLGVWFVFAVNFDAFLCCFWVGDLVSFVLGVITFRQI